MFYRRKEKSLQVMRSGETESEPKEDEVDERFPIKIRKGISKNTADSRETICHSSSQLRTKKVSRQLCLLFSPTNVMYISSSTCK